MANEILLTPAQMRERAMKIRSYKEEQEEVMSRLTNLVNSLSTVWRGESQDAFVARYLGMKSTFQNFSNSIEDYAKLIETTASDMEQTDNSLASRIRNV